MRDVIGCSPTLHGNGGEVAILHFLRIGFMSFHRNPTGSNHVDGDSKGCQFLGHASRPANLRPFGGHVGAERRDRFVKDFAGDVDYPSDFCCFMLPSTRRVTKNGLFKKKSNMD